MNIGNINTLSSKFYGYEQRLTKCIEKEWNLIRCKISSNDLERDISKRLFANLKKNRELRAIGIPTIEYMLITEDKKGDPVTKGFIDIAILIDEYRDPDTYIAYECKRLSLNKNGKWSSLAGKYASEGIARYVRAQYAHKLPVGCMLGYVMDSDLSKARKAVISVINNNKTKLMLIDHKNGESPHRFISHHSQITKSNSISIVHTLLAV